MLTNRVTKRKRGYERKKGWISVPYTTSHVIELIELRCEEGYLLGWTKEKNGLKVYLRYTEEGTPSISKRKRRWKPSRIHTVDARQRWSVGQMNGERGTLIMQTTQGRITSVEARKKKLGGIVWRWIM
jgi:ribosomal protein S8